MYKYFDNDDLRFFKILACVGVLTASFILVIL
jgi:hypothetical protein